MAKSKKNKLGSILSSVFCLFFLAGVIAAIVFVVRDVQGGLLGGKDEMSIEYNGKSICGGENIDLPEGGQARFNVSVDGGYKVQVLPNVTSEDTFNFYVGGVAYPYIQENFTDYFISRPNIYDNYFVIECKYEQYTVRSALSYWYSSDNLLVNENRLKYPFKLVVTSVKSGKFVSFGMRQVNREKSIEFDYDGDIVF